MEAKIGLTKTKKGHPAFWECGGGCSNTGEVYIVAGSNFEPLRPVYIRRRGHLSNNDHALFIVKEGYHIIFCNHHRRDMNIVIYKIEKIIEENEQLTAICSVINKFDCGEWDNPVINDNNFEAAITAAKEKAVCYHCREVHYALKD